MNDGVARCSRNPELWELWTMAGTKSRRKVPLEQAETAVANCRVCPLLAWCATLKPEPGMVQAGKAYDDFGREYPSLRDFNRERLRPAEGSGCGDAVGTMAGYWRHRRYAEKPCTECRQARSEGRTDRARKPVVV